MDLSSIIHGFFQEVLVCMVLIEIVTGHLSAKMYHVEKVAFKVSRKICSGCISNSYINPLVYLFNSLDQFFPRPMCF